MESSLVQDGQTPLGNSAIEQERTFYFGIVTLLHVNRYKADELYASLTTARQSI